MVEFQANKIESLLNALVQLLSKNDESKLTVVFNNLLDKYNISESKLKVVRMITSIMHGGSGSSLSDLVIQKDGKVLTMENNRLNKLLDELYDECKKFQ